MQSLIVIALCIGALAHPQLRDKTARSELTRADAKSSATSIYYEPVKTEELTPLNPGAKRTRIWFGPFNLNPANASHGLSMGKMDPNSDSFSGPVRGLPSGLVLSTNSSLKYEDGSVADVVNGVYNHHLMFVDTSKVGRGALRCATGWGQAMPNMGMLMGASEANRELQFKVADVQTPTGFVLGSRDWLMLNGEIVNYTNETKKVYAVSDMEYLPEVPQGALDSYLNVYQLDTCNDKPSEMPHNQAKWSAQGGKATIAQDGYIGFIRGHMHDGGVNVELKVNGKIVCDSRAVYGGADQTTIVDGKEWATISRMEACSTPVKVAKGDMIEITANFDVEQHPQRKQSHGMGMGENMGLVTFIFAPTK